MRAKLRRSVATAVATVLGLVWAQIALVIAAVLLPERLALAPRIARGVPFRLAQWTLLAPLTAAVRVVTVSGEQATSVRPTFSATLLCALLATSVCVVIAAAMRHGRFRTALRALVLAVFITATASTVVVAGQLHDAVAAQREYFALVSRTAKLWADDGTAQRAAAFVVHHPLSRWRSEALRIVAMNESARGHLSAAESTWREFEACFDDPVAPGVAYAEYSRALCFEQLRKDGDAIAHNRAAIGVIRARGDGIQGWIAPDAARRIASLERQSGMPVAAAYWTTQSQTLKDVCSIE